MGNPFGRSTIIPLTNKSGGGVVAGDVVIVDTTNNDAFTTTTSANFTGGLGVAQQTIGSNAVGLVAIGGYVALVNVNASVTRGHFGATYTVAKQATDAGASRAAGTFCMFLTGGTTPDAYIWQPDLGGGSGMTNPMTTTGDMIYSSSGSTPARLAAVAAGQAILSQGTSTPPAYGYPPGHEFDYVESTSPTSITATVEASANTVVTGNAVTYDGSTTIFVEFFSNAAYSAATANVDITIFLFDGSTSLGYWGVIRSETTNRGQAPLHLMRRLTPSAGAHTYSCRAVVGSGTGSVTAGAGGTGNAVPSFIRQTKV